jgi:hypothetical protein
LPYLGAEAWNTNGMVELYTGGQQTIEIPYRYYIKLLPLNVLAK